MVDEFQITAQLVWAIGRQRVTPAKPVAIDEGDPAQHLAIIHPGLAVAIGEARALLRHQPVRQPIKLADIRSPRRA